MFSVVGVVVIYLNGIQTQQDQYEALYQNTTDVTAPIDIVPLPVDEGTIIDTEEGTNEIIIEGEEEKWCYHHCPRRIRYSCRSWKYW